VNILKVSPALQTTRSLTAKVLIGKKGHWLQTLHCSCVPPGCVPPPVFGCGETVFGWHRICREDLLAIVTTITAGEASCSLGQAPHERRHLRLAEHHK
jgi:hypothetical protein